MAFRPVKTQGPASTTPARRGLPAIVWQGLWVLAWLLPVALIAGGTRWPAVTTPLRPLAEGVGYKGVADTLAGWNVLSVRSVPRRRGFVPLQRVALDQTKTAARLGDCTTWAQRQSWSPWYVGDRSAPCAGVLKDYLAKSYLADDLLTPAQWTTDGNAVTELRSGSHALLAAGNLRDLWTGTIRFSDEDAAVAPGVYSPARASLALAEVGSERTVFRFVAGARDGDLTLDDLLSNTAPAKDGAQLAVSLTKGTSALFGAPNPVRFQRIGNALAIGLPPGNGQIRVILDNVERTQPDNGFSGYRFILMRPAQFLVIEDVKSGRTISLQLVVTTGSVSAATGGHRVREASLYDVSQWLEQAGVNGDFTSSIVGSLQFDLQQRLARAMAQDAPAGSAPDHSYRGAVLMMDGLSGEIAAAATYPTDLGQLTPADRNRDLRIAWLKQNFNFQPLDVGSSAKVPFATAITQRHPGLLGMTIARRSSFSDIDMGPGRKREELKLPDGSLKSLGNSNFKTSPITFNDFLYQSNNEYALTLMARAKALDGGDWISRNSWAANLWQYACVIPFGLQEYSSTDGWTGEAGCSPYLWRDAAGPVGKQPRSSAWIRLGMVNIQNPYTDYYLDILGGNRSRWTTANLAQAYARILSQRRVSPRLLKVGEQARPDGLSVNPQVWRSVTGGMRDVIRIGTAKDLGDGVFAPGALPPGVEIWAKTGTPDLDYPKDAQGHVIVIAAVRTRDGKPAARPSDICGLKIMVINLQRKESLALSLAATLFDAKNGGAYLKWMTQPCPPKPAYER